MREALKVGISGVRGIVGDSLSPRVACGFAQAFGAFLGGGSVLVGRDTRPSGQMFEAAVVAGLQSVGCRPILAGVVPTPTMLFQTREIKARGGIMISASHNPAPWNAFKFIGPEGLFLDGVQAEELFDVYHQQDYPLVGEGDLLPAKSAGFIIENHFRKIIEYVDFEAVQNARFKIAVDCCNGVGALYSRNFLQDLLGCEVISIHDNPSGHFERDPEPLPANLSRLQEVVREHGCALGFAQDPDGDRLALVDEQGNALIEDLTVAFCVGAVLLHHQQGPVTLNLATSKAVEDLARSCGAKVVRSRIGEIHVVSVMKEQGAVVGGEHNGGVVVPAIHPCRDSFTGMALVLELMAKTGRTLSDLRRDVPVYHVVKDKFPVRAEDAPGLLRKVRSAYSFFEQITVDGVHVNLGDRWFLLRRSNTEPVMRITTEARSPESAAALRDEVLAVLAGDG